LPRTTRKKSPKAIIPKPTPVKLGLFQKLSLFFFRRPRKTALIWLIVALFGAASYLTLLKREGFPDIVTPFAVSQGAYIVNDPAKVDAEVARPLSDFILKQSGVKTVLSQSYADYYVVMISYNEDVNAEARSAEIQKQIDEQNILPDQVVGQIKAFELGFTDRGDDLVISFYQNSGEQVDYRTLASEANQAAEFLKNKNLSTVEDISIINPFESAANPQSGAQEVTQQTFERYGKKEGSDAQFFNSIVIGVKAKDGIDQLQLDKEIRGAIDNLNAESEFRNFRADVSASNAPQINSQINELQRTLLEGLLAVLVVGSLVIAVRASIITVISMVTVIAITNGLLYLIGFSLNTITLFGLVLALSLIVDDTIIMVEAIDAQRRKRKNPDEVIKVATGKVGQAMIAATTTAALSFAPLLFVSGIIGSFIKAIPITIISALFISLLVALIFIPLFSRYLLLRDKQLGPRSDKPESAKIEEKIARFLSAPMLWAKHSRKKLFAVGIAALIIGFGFIGGGAYLFKEVKFSIFPTDSDSNLLSVSLRFQPGTSITEAEALADKTDTIVKDTLGEDFIRAAYYSRATAQQADLSVDIRDYKERDITAPQLVDKLNAAFVNFDGASVKASQIGVGPPAAQFTARVDSSQNRPAAVRLATDIAEFLKSAELKRTDGSTTRLDAVTGPNESIYSRENETAFVTATGQFKDTDTSALVTLAQSAVEKEFPDDRVASYGLDRDALKFNFGQEDENQDSFKALLIAFPILLVVIYILLAAQFRSLLQPLLIFMAIPFSLFGITLGLYLTENPFSFFAMLGFFALIGLSIKNTILLTDYANQSRKAGMDAVDAAHEALAERFRPLVATSLTAVVSLIPLALTSPFWEGLAVVLIFGLLSSTFLVLTVFPYYYLGSEFLRQHFSRKRVVLWLIASAALVALLTQAGFGLWALLAPLVAAVILTIFKRSRLI
jgi:multidrug efflux pump subunit AcrB